MKLTWKDCKPTVVLGSICLIVALALSLVNALTAPVIEENTRIKQQESLLEVVPGGDFGETLSGLTLPKTVSAVYEYEDKNGGGYVLLLSSTNTYTGDSYDVTVAVSKEGRIIKSVTTKFPDTRAVGDYGKRFEGKDAAGVSDVDTLAGATISSTAFHEMMEDALRALSDNGLIGGSEG